MIIYRNVTYINSQCMGNERFFLICQIFLLLKPFLPGSGSSSVLNFGLDPDPYGSASLDSIVWWIRVTVVRNQESRRVSRHRRHLGRDL